MRERGFLTNLREHAKAYRTDNGDIGIKEMAEKVGLTYTPYKDFEDGRSVPREDALEKIIGLVLPRSKWGILADRLRNIADVLSSTDIPEDVKHEEYIRFIGSVNAFDRIIHDAPPRDAV